MKNVEIIIPTLGHIKKTAHPYSCFERLRHVPWPSRLHVITGGRSWAEAINIGLAQTDGESDVILMDDDVFLRPDTFSDLESNYDAADIFGFKLLFADGRIQHAGGIFRGGMGHIGFGEVDGGQYDEPAYVCHVTTSLTYIKRHVINELKGMALLPGVQFEDVDWSLRALKANFRILYLPGAAVHLESATKKFMPQFQEKMAEAVAEVGRRHLSSDSFRALLETYPRPLALEAVPA